MTSCYLKFASFSIFCTVSEYNHIVTKKIIKKQAQRRAAAETAAFIRVVRYNDESSFNLDNDFDMNPVSPKTWPHMGPIWVTIWATHMGPIRFLSTCFIWIPCGFPNIVQISAQSVQKGPACVAQLGSQILVISNNARTLVSWTAMWQRSVINKTKNVILVYHENWLLIKNVFRK